MYKKIALICATIATAGLLMTGCSRNWNTELRRRVCEDLNKVPNRMYRHNVKEKDLIITAESKGFYYSTLEVTITNKTTGDVLKMTDYGLRWGGFILPENGYCKGVDNATFNGYENSLEGLDKKFDEALETIKPHLENKIAEETEKVNKSTNLK